MKLWKSFKFAARSGNDNDNNNNNNNNNINDDGDNNSETEDVRLRQCSESPDSGLPGDKTARRIVIQLDRHYGDDLGFILAGRPETGLPPTVAGFRKDSVVQDADRFAPGDKICSINGISTARLTNEEVLSLLDNVEERASLEVEYYMPDFDSQNSLCVNAKVTQISVEKVNGSLGMTLRGGELSRCNSDESNRSFALGAGRSSGPFVITYVRPGGPVYATGRIKSGDRLLKVDNISLSNKTLSDAYKILQNSSQITNLTIEYDVSIMESVKYATGPLLVEIERTANESLGIILTNSNGGNSQCHDDVNAFYIEAIIPGSISDRCGALRPGDRLLAVNDLLLENVAYTPDEVMHYIDNYAEKGFTKLQIYPIHILMKHYRLYKPNNKQSSSPISGMSTLNSRKSHRQNKQMRQSSLPKTFEMDSEIQHNNFVTGVGVCRSEVLSLQLEIPPNCDSGIVVCEDRDMLIISHITHQSPAYLCGCIQPGDRVLSINSIKNASEQTANDILQRCNDTNSAQCLHIKTEFDMADNIEASSGVFNVKLAKIGAGLGVTITGSKQGIDSAEEPMIISNIKIGSVAYRNGTLAVGDQIIAIDSQPLSNLSLEDAFNILQNFPDDIITLTIRKLDKTNSWNNLGGLSMNRSYGEISTVNCNNATSRYKNMNSPFNAEHHNREEILEDGYYILDLEVVKPNGESLGLTVAGSEDASQPIIVSNLVKDGLAEKSGAIQIGDRILFINDENVQNRPLSEAIRILQSSSHKVKFKLLRKSKNINKNMVAVEATSGNMQQSSDEPSTETHNNRGKIEAIQPEALSIDTRLSYLATDENKLLASGYKTSEELPMPNYNFINTLTTSFKNNNNDDVNLMESFNVNTSNTDDERNRGIFFSQQLQNNRENHRIDSTPNYETDLLGFYNMDSITNRGTIHHVTLYKDVIYDDYGFSVSDGLYERGVYINRIRKGGPADIVGLLKPYDRILQVNGTRTVDFDCCLTVPLIASAGDRIELVLQRLKDTNSWCEDNNSNVLENDNIITKTI